MQFHVRLLKFILYLLDTRMCKIMATKHSICEIKCKTNFELPAKFPYDKNKYEKTFQLSVLKIVECI